MAAPILFFGDGSLPLHPAFSRMLQSRKDDSLLSMFLSRARLSVQYEISQIPRPDRRGISDLSEWEKLARQTDYSTPDHQCLAPAMVVLLQLGQFISWHEARPELPYPDSTSAITVGLCVGQLSAVAVSQARSLSELIPLAVESVRIAFRTGFTAITVRDELEPQTSGRESWAMTVSREVGLTENSQLETIQQDLGILPRKRAYVSAAFRKVTTIQGPPSTLDKIESWLTANCSSSPKKIWQRIPIYTPYHASHLYSEENVEDILAPRNLSSDVYHNSEITSPKPRLVSPLSGGYYSPSTRRSMMKSVLHDILKEPIDWGNVTAGCVEHVTTAGISSWVVRPFGPTFAAASLVSTLNAEAKVQVVLEDSFGSNKLPTPGTSTREPIAIVGMAGKFPESMSHNELWNLLEKGIDCHKVIPADRFDANIYVAKDGAAKNPTGSRYGCFMKKPGLFDARFFNLSPREAEQTDPQQRLALATAYEALEMSGFVPNRTPSTQLERCGTYYGQTTDDYREINAAQDIQTYYVSGVDRAFGPGRINHHFKFGGPSMSVDTACSSSAVAMNLACTALWTGECETALVGGMTLLSNPDIYCGLSRGHFLNETGNCKTFDDKADGYCRGEAVASVVVKRLSEAQADNDSILAVILAVGTNYSAASASITHPHGPTQEVLYRRLLAQGGLQPFDVDYIEMHGTGTQAGDAAEMSSVSNVFATAIPSRSAEYPLWLGSVKANVGHGESASGITALVKTLLVFQKEIIPPHVGIKSGIMNRTFPDLEKRNIRIALHGKEAFPRRQERKRRALVNNFGAAGGNTAMLLEEAPIKEDSGIDDTRPIHIISVTAKTSASMKGNIRNLIMYLEEQPRVSLSDLSYTTTARRMQFALRVSVLASSVSDLKGKLASALADENFKPITRISKIVFAFTGQGSLYLPLAKELYEDSKQFRLDMNRFNQMCRDQGFSDFLPVIDGSVKDLASLSPTQSQLAITAVQMSLCRLWESWGVKPTAVIGHSLGEYAALYASGVLSAHDALFLVGRRAGILEATCTRYTHCMLSVHSTITKLEKVLGKGLESLEVACINGPEDFVLSGRAEVTHEIKNRLKALGVKCGILKTPYAFHSAQIDPILDEFETAAQSAKFMKPRIPVLSPLLGSVIKEAGVVGPLYLRRHAREVVDFRAALQKAEVEGLTGSETIWLEVGPNPVCLGMLKSTVGGQTRGMPSLREGENSWTTSAKALSILHTLGVHVDFNEYHRDFERGQNLLDIPRYAFDEKNYWLEYKNDWALKKGDDAATKITKALPDPILTTTVQRLISKEAKGNEITFVFETDLSEPNMHDIISGHIINGLALCPAGVYADMAFTVADYIRKKCKVNVATTGIDVTEMEILGPVVVPIPRVVSPQLVHMRAVANLDSGMIDVTFGSFSTKTKNMTPSAKCRVMYGNQKSWHKDWSRTAWLVHKRMQGLERGAAEGTTDKIFKKMAYQLFSSIVNYSPNYHSMQEVLVNSEELEASAIVKLHEGTDAGSFFASPLWIDGVAQLSGYILNGTGFIDPRVAAYISHGWESMQLALPMDPTKPYRVHAKMQPLTKSMIAGDVSIFQDGSMVGLIKDVKFQRLPRALLDTMLAPPASSNPTNARALPNTAPATAITTAPTPKKAAPAPSPPKLASQERETVTPVLKLIAEEIGVSMADISDDCDFSELGVDSLLSLTILSKIRETLQMDLSPSIFQDCQTVGDLRRALGDNSGSDLSDDQSDGTLETPPESGLATPELVPVRQSPVSDDNLHVLYTIIAEQIGIETEELLANDDLSALGVDSLMSLSIAAALREKLGIDVPSTLSDGMFSLKTIRSALNLTKTKSRAQSMLLQGNPKTSSKTLFLFPDGSGSATSYAGLPEIAPNICVFAINSPFIKAPEEYTCSLEEISNLMVNEVRFRQPKGPYLLAGWSAGGMYAYEAAMSLNQAGETIEKLILIDSPCRLEYGPMPKDVLEYVSRSGVINGKATGTAPQWLVDHFQGTIRAIQEYRPRAFDPATAPETAIIWASKGVFEDWPRGELAGLDMTHEIAKWMLKPKTNPGALAWDRLLAREKISVVDVEGNHFSMVHPPNCKSLSHALADSIMTDTAKREGKWRKA